ncbi:MAG: trigger factor [Chloroflexota bacterium]|jgi:trigger factor|nr:trigger factor [Chloroflexota bacterium]
MNVTTTPGSKSSVLLEVELPSERLDRSMGEAVRRLARRTKVPGFRPGKAPRFMLERVLGPTAVLDEAVELLLESAYRDALVEQGIVPLAQASVDVVQAEEGKPFKFKATVQIPPEVTLGDYAEFKFKPEIEPTDEVKLQSVIDELRDNNASLRPVEDRPAQNGDYAVIGFVGTRDGVPFEGGSSERMPLILGEERLIPGFETNLIGLSVGGTTEFDIEFPADYGEPTLAGQTAHFAVDLKELREKLLPELDDEFARSMGEFADVDALRTEIRRRLERNALDRARHGFADRIIEYAVANATVELPDILVDQEVEVMHDEFRTTLARQGIAEPAYLKATEKTEADLHTEFRPRAESRVKTLLVLSRIAEAEGTEVSDADVEAEIAGARGRYADEPRTLAYFDSERGRNFIRSTLRRTRTVETLVDRWLAAHPEHPALPHAEEDDDDRVTANATAAAAAAASIERSDPSSDAKAGGGAGDDRSDAERNAEPESEPEPVSQGASVAERA